MIKTFQTVFWALKQLWKAASIELMVVSFFVLTQGLTPAASLFAIQGIINWIDSTASFPSLFIILWGGMLFIETVMTPIISIYRLNLNEKILERCNLLLMEKANTLDSLEPFENPKFYDEMQFLKNESSRRPLNFVYIVTGFARDFITLLSILGVLFSIAWWIPFCMLLAGIPHALSTFWFEKQAWDQMLFSSPESRKMAWLASLPLDSKAAKEIRLFDFGAFLSDKYKEIVKKTHETLSKERWEKSKLFILLSALTVIGNIIVLSVVLLQTKNGGLLIAEFIVVIQAIFMTQTQLANCIANFGMFAPALLFFSKLRNFLRNPLDQSLRIKKASVPNFIREIQFNNVTFRYSDGREALSNVSFTIKHGEKVAIVGENGAGKSTIVKLLLRFYDPTEGSITINGQNLLNFEPKEWRSKISGVFQDFGQYHLSIKENISLTSKDCSEESILKAIQKGGFFPILERLPLKLNTLLGKEFGGTTLSGGEWQRLAMSRAFLKNANLLILDEPTASLDPQNEQETFKKFAEQADTCTTLLITHRLGSIKMANKILVLKKGSLIEQGTHTSLLSLKGEYAHLFNIQADQYLSN